MTQVLFDYVITFGWAVVGSVSMGIALVITVKLFTIFTVHLNEEQLLKDNNIAVAIVLSSIILSCALVVGAVIRP